MKKYINKVNIILIMLLLICGVTVLLNSILDFEVPTEYNIGIGNELDNPLKKGDEIEIVTTSRLSNLEALHIEISPIKDTDNIRDCIEIGDGFVSIYDEDDKLIYYSDLKESQVFDNHELYFKFDRIKDSLNKKYRIVIEISEKLDHRLFKLKQTPSDNKLDSAKINDEELEGDLSIVQYGTTSTTFYRTLFVTIFFIIFAIFSRYNFKNNQKLKEMFLRKKKVFVLEFILSLIASFSYLTVVYKHVFYEMFDVWMYGIFIISTLIIIFVLSVLLDKKLKKEELFLLVGIPISVLYLVFVLPLNVPDEYSHYRTTIKVSMFQFFNQDIMVPKNLEALNIYSLFNNDISYNNLESARAGGYHPMLYIFSGFGVLLSKLLQLSPIIGIYMGRCANLIVFLILGYFTIKKIPMGKFLMLIYLLNPMFLQQSASLSADALTNIFSMLFISYILYIKYDKKEVETKDFLILFISYAYVLVGKYAYFLLGLLFILIWKDLKKYFKKHKKTVFIVTIIVFLIAVSWFAFTRLSNSEIETLTYNKPQSEVSKLSYILNNPANIIPIYVNTIISNINFYVVSFFGGALGSLNIAVSQIYVIAYIIILFLSIFIDKEKYEFDKKSKIISIIIFVLTFHIVLVGLYFGWGVITDLFIQGVQGRYFIPIVILLFLPLIKKRNINLNKISVPLLVILLVTNILIMKDIITYFLV